VKDVRYCKEFRHMFYCQAVLFNDYSIVPYVSQCVKFLYNFTLLYSSVWVYYGDMWSVARR